MKKFKFKICLIDACLIVFMVILIFQAIINLFGNIPNNALTSEIDIITRTSQTTIFGYFLSENFGKCKSRGIYSNKRIDSKPSFDSVQTIVVSCVGIISLIILVSLCAFPADTSKSADAISQNRVFLTSSIGFLVGSGKKSNRK